MQEPPESLRRLDVAAEYEQAHREWDAGGEGAIWDVAAGDGVCHLQLDG